MSDQLPKDSNGPSKPIDIVVVIDSTGSMDHYLMALVRIIPQLQAIRGLTSRIRRIGVLSYKDYYQPPVLSIGQRSVIDPVPVNDEAARLMEPLLTIDDVVEWSGWDEPPDMNKAGDVGRGRILGEWVKGLVAEGGGDYPEAAKTALRKLLDILGDSRSKEETKGDVEEDTLVLWFTDSPPHHRSQRGFNRLLEIAAHHPPNDDTLPKINLKSMNFPTPRGANFPADKCLDWVHLCRAASAAKLRVFTFLPATMPVEDTAFWVMLGTLTRGHTHVIGNKEQATMPKRYEPEPHLSTEGGTFMKILVASTIHLVLEHLALPGISVEDTAVPTNLAATSLRFEDDITKHLPENRTSKPNEWDGKVLRDEDYSSQDFLPREQSRYNALEGRLRPIVETPMVEDSQASSATQPQDLPLAANDEASDVRESVIALLYAVAELDVEALYRVKLFSEMWKSATSWPSFTAQEFLITTFLNRLTKIRNTDIREAIENWAAISSNRESEVYELIHNRDETSNAQPSTGDLLILEEGSVTTLGISQNDLSNLCTSYDHRLLEKIGNLLRYTKISPAGDSTSTKRFIDVGKALPQTVFRLLPHLAFEGMLYSPRTAIILAIVAITAGIPHLERPARGVVEGMAGKWIDARTPENFTTQFISFILSAPCSEEALSSEERALYLNMARYAYLEEQLDIKLQARVPWTPMKTRGIGDRKRVCEGCGIRRSETMMHQVGSYEDGGKAGNDEAMRCGMCVDSDKNPQDWRDLGEIHSCWVECSERWCRAQYVIEDEDGLRIPPRCYYCRKRKPCPWIECTVCANRIVLPKSYRIPPDDTLDSFVCPPCRNEKHTGHKTIVPRLTTLRSILFANAYRVEWLGVQPFREVFRGRTTFMLWELYGNDIFAPAPPLASSPPPSPASTRTMPTRRMQLNGKKLLNAAEIKDELDAGVERRLHVRTVLCPITFEHVPESELTRVCLNDACDFLASLKGLKRWYTGQDDRRRLCPSCRSPHVKR